MDELNIIDIYKHLFEKSPLGYAIHKIVLNEKKEPVDYVFIDINHSFEVWTGLKRENVIGKKVTELIKGIENDKFNWIKFYGDIALNEERSEEFEQYSEKLKRYYKVYVYCPIKLYFITVFIDITDLKKNKKIT